MATITSKITDYLKNNTLDESTITALEILIAEKFLAVNSLSPLAGSRIEALLSSDNAHIDATVPTGLFNDVETISTDDLVSSFEVLVPTAEAKEFGAFFTPEQITSFMAKSLLQSLDDKGFNLADAEVLDPAVGCGALLIAAALELSNRTGKTFAECSAQLTGTDLSANSIQRAHLLFELVALKQGDTTIPNPDLRVESGLTKTSKKYAGIIANPPYVRYQMLSDSLRAELKNDWSSCQLGNYNLYFAFMEKAHQSLEDNGSSYFITPNGFIHSKSGVGLREWIREEENVSSILDFGKNKVFQVMTYTAITHFEKSRHAELTYAKVDGIKGLLAYQNQPKTAYKYSDLKKNASWDFIDSSETKAVDLISQNPVPLGDLFDVRYGLATLRDKLFSFRSTLADGYYPLSYEGKTYLIEEGLVKKCVKVSGLKQESDIATDDLKIIYPYTVVGDKAVPMDEDFVRTNYPEGFKYLLAIKAELAKRDKGHKQYPEWFSYGRSQGLIPYEKKILTPLYLIQPRFMMDDTASLFINGCALVPKAGVDINLTEVQGFLNSDVVRDFMLATSNPIDGGFVAYQKTQLGRLRLPKFG